MRWPTRNLPVSVSRDADFGAISFHQTKMAAPGAKAQRTIPSVILSLPTGSCLRCTWLSESRKLLYYHVRDTGAGCYTRLDLSNRSVEVRCCGGRSTSCAKQHAEGMSKS